MPAEMQTLNLQPGTPARPALSLSSGGSSSRLPVLQPSCPDEEKTLCLRGRCLEPGPREFSHHHVAPPQGGTTHVAFMRRVALKFAMCGSWS